MSVTNDVGYLVSISPRMRCYFERRGLWSNGRPGGKLALWLDRRVPTMTDEARFLLTWEQLHDLMVGFCNMDHSDMTGQQWAQFLRRLKESATKPVRLAASGAQLVPASAPDVAVALDPTSAKPRRSKSGACGAPPVPFEPLQRPAQGAAKLKFEDQLMKTLREFVDFTQSSAWIDDPQA